MKKLLFCTLMLLPSLLQAQTFTPKANFPGPGRAVAFSFTLGNNVFTGAGFDSLYTGTDSIGYYNDFWKYNTVSDTWTQMNNLPFAARTFTSALVINGKAYAGFGFDTSNLAVKDWWQYNAAGDTWTRKADFPGEARYSPGFFSWNGKGYLIGGQTFTTDNTHPLNDIWQYSPATDSWSQEPDFTGPARCKAFCEVINDTLYYGLGQDDTTGDYYADIYKYNLITKTWTSIASVLPTANVPVVDGLVSTSFAYNNKIVLMNLDITVTVPDDYESVYVYDIPSAAWTVYPLMNNAGFRILPVNGRVGSKAYVGLGWDYNNNIWFQDMWELDMQDFVTGIEKANPDLANIRVSSFAHAINTSIPAGVLSKGKAEMSVYDMDGKCLRTYTLAANDQFDLNGLPSGNYAFRVKCGTNILKTGIVSLN